MSDLFHEDVPDEFIISVFKIMNQAYWHRFQILTKRSKRLLELSPRLNWADNIWMGVSVEDSEQTYRINELRQTDAIVKFISFEPLLGLIPDLNLDDIDWVIVGGESGPHSRHMDYQWVTSIRDQCQNLTVPFFFKQWGGVQKKKNGRELEGRTWDEMPIARPINSTNAFFIVDSEI
jgi:protein gp37